MRYLNTMQMLTEQVDLRDIVTLTVREPLGYHRSFAGKGRACNVLMLYNIGQRRYTVSGSSTQFTLHEHDILYVPQYAEYGFDITDCGGQSCDYAFALNFLMTDVKGEPVCFGKEPRILVRDRLSHYFSLFERLERTCGRGKTEIMYQKSLAYALFYEILCETRADEARQDRYGVIAPAIDAIENDPACETSVPLLAKMCGIGETRFRQLFLQYSGGVSLIEYRNRLRIDNAEKLLRTQLVTVEYAALSTGFHDLSHFYRLYKKYKGTTPHAAGTPSVPEAKAEPDEKKNTEKC